MTGLASHPVVAAQQKPVLGWLSARVVDRTGGPVSAIVVVKGLHSRVGRTDGRGSYKVAIPPGRYQVSAIYAGHSTRPQKVTVVPNRSRQITIKLSVAAGPSTRAGQGSSPSAPSPNPTQPIAAGAGTNPSRTGSSGGASLGSQAGAAASGQSGSGAPAPAAGGAVASSPQPGPGPLTLQGLTADPTVTGPGGTSRITVQVANPVGDRLTYSWQASGGTVNATGSKAVWTAPQAAGDFTVSVVVSAIITGQKATGSVSVSVQGGSSPTPTPPANSAPQISSTSADPTVVAPGGTSTLLVNATDPDGDPLTFSWQASGGTITPQGNQAIWIAPGTAGQFSIAVRADDGKGLTASASISVSVETAPTGTRDPALWPFSTYSPWNMPIGSGATYAPVNANGKTAFTPKFDVFEERTIWVPTASTPFRDVYDNPGPWDPNSPPSRFRYRIRIGPSWYPAGAFNVASPLPWFRGGRMDLPMDVFSADHMQVYELFGVPYPLEDPMQVDDARAPYSATGMGIGPGPDTMIGTRAYGGSGIAGTVRAGEATTLGGIRHALSAIVHTSDLNKYGPGGKPYVWPATSADAGAGYGTTGNVYMGSLFAIPPNININALGLQTSQALELARALQDYGLYIVDTHGGAAGELRFYLHPGAIPDFGTWNSSLRTAIAADMQTVLRVLQVVTNNSPTSVGGGGTPRRPLAPPFVRN